MIVIDRLHIPGQSESFRRIRTWCVILALVGAAVFVWPPLATAGTMRVYSCHTPTGDFVGLGGWEAAGFSLRYNAAVQSNGVNGCAEGSCVAGNAGFHKIDEKIASSHCRLPRFPPSTPVDQLGLRNLDANRAKPSQDCCAKAFAAFCAQYRNFAPNFFGHHYL